MESFNQIDFAFFPSKFTTEDTKVSFFFLICMCYQICSLLWCSGVWVGQGMSRKIMSFSNTS